MKHEINSSKAPEPVGSYPHARRVGNLLFLSGVGPRKPGTKVIPGVMMDGQGNALGHDIEVQCHSVFENIKNILEDFEPRVQNVKVTFGEVSDRNEMNITIFYNIKNNAQSQEMDFTITRAR